MLLGRLAIVFVGDRAAVPQPLGRNMGRELVGQLRGTCCPKILKQFRPRLQTGSADDFAKLCTKIDVALAVTGNNGQHTRWRHLWIEVCAAEQFVAYCIFDEEDYENGSVLNLPSENVIMHPDSF